MGDKLVLVGGGNATKNVDDFAANETDGVLSGVGINDGTQAPSAADSAGTKGDVVITDSYIYVCTDTDTWKRASLSTWS